MIGYIKGNLLDVQNESCTILTSGGLGYVLHAPAPLLERLPEVGNELALHVHTVVREDSIDLYGFGSKEEQKAFRLLIAVSKLGPKTALAILSTFDPSSLSQIVVQGDDTSLTRVPGIGPKSAKRIIWELKDRFDAGLMVPSADSTGLKDAPRGSTFADALTGLTNLGYSESEIRPLLNEILSQEPELLVAEAIRAVLKKKSLDAR